MVSRQVRRRGLHSERCWGKYDINVVGTNMINVFRKNIVVRKSRVSTIENTCGETVANTAYLLRVPAIAPTERFRWSTARR
jgi:hypothetical protein